MATAAKYLFDLDFSGGAEVKPTISLAEHQAKLAEAEAAGYRNGISVAEAQALTDSGRLGAMALDRIAIAFSGLDQALRAVEAKLEAEAVEVAVAVGRKLAPALIAREPLAEITALATDCFRQIVAAPHIVVRVNDALYAATRDSLEEILRTSGFEGRLVVLAEPDIAIGDCRIEWADGGVKRDRASTEAAVSEAVNRYLAGRTEAAISHDNPRKVCIMSNTDANVPLPDLEKSSMQPLPDGIADVNDSVTRSASDLEAVFDVPVQVSAVLGRARMDVGELLKLGPGAVLELDRKVGEAIDIYVNNRLVARGEVVLVEDKLGVTMTEIIKAERN